MAIDRKRVLKPVKRLRKLVTQLDRRPTPEKVHDLRTKTRQIEAISKAFSLERRGISTSMLKDLGRFRKRAGKVRDMDVLTSFAAAVRVHGEKDCAVQLLERLGAERRKQAKKLQAEVEKAGPAVRSHLKRTPAVLAKHIPRNGRVQAQNPAVYAAAAALKLAVELAAPQRLSRDNLHAYRLKVKELRNVLQLAAGNFPKFVEELGAVKDAIGEWHDREELVSIAAKTLDHGNGCRLLVELKRIASRKYEQALVLTEALRTKYLGTTRPLKKDGAAARPKIPAKPVWDAIAMLIN
jgi:CHAD domain-containing protein